MRNNTNTTEERSMLLGIRQAADMLGIGRTNVYTLLKNGELRSVRIGGRRLIPRESIESFVTELEAKEGSAMSDTLDTLPVRLVYTIQEAAEELRIGNSTVRERIRMGQLRSFKDGSRRLIAREDLLEYIQALRETTGDR